MSHILSILFTRDEPTEFQANGINFDETRRVFQVCN